jgi:release factor glutamine methyltransferase
MRRDEIVQAEHLQLFKQMIKRRIRRDPVAYILGYSEFMGLPMFVNEHTLIPRPETELLVEEVLRRIPAHTTNENAGTSGAGVTVADIGTGSGCIAVSLAKLSPGTCVYASDISKDALLMAGKNAAANGVSGTVMFKHGDLFEPFEREGLMHTFDIIVSNPPYVLSGEIQSLEPELMCEPRLALDGGTDGLDFYHRLAASGKHFLKAGGFLAVEIHAQKSVQTAEIFAQHGYEMTLLMQDYSHLDRIMILKKPLTPARERKLNG